MPERVDRIAQVLRCAGVLIPNDYTESWDYSRKINELAAKIDSELHPIIETVEQLDALPEESIVRGRTGMPWHKGCGHWWPASASGGGRPATMIALPARLLHSPGDDHA